MLTVALLNAMYIFLYLMCKTETKDYNRSINQAKKKTVNYNQNETKFLRTAK